jgi:hypothetical protein
MVFQNGRQEHFQHREINNFFNSAYEIAPSTSKALFQEVLTDLPPVFPYIKAFLTISLV